MTTDNPKTPSEVDDEDAKWWLAEIDAAKDRLEKWYERAKSAIDRYRDCERKVFGKLNILWANVEVQKAALGEDFGKPQVNRLNAPSHAFLSRHVSRVWEQTIDAAVKDTGDNREIRNSVHDILLPGRGQVWLELNPVTDDQGNVTWVEAPIVKLGYEDYLEGPANRWGEVPWVARGHLFTLDDLTGVLGLSKEEAETVPRNYALPMPKGVEKDGNDQSKEQFKRARVWEVWAKFPEKRRIYVIEGYDKAPKVDPDPYRLKNFFPCPRPIIANGDEAWQEPLTDYSRYQDQAEEVDRISERIFVLTDTLRRRGIHDKQFKELADLALAGDNVSLAVDNWVDLQAKGGLNKVVEWEDLAPIIGVLAQLHQQRAELIQLIFELTGISDLARGMTDPDETATAQKLKQTFGSGRFQARQKESRRFATDAYAIKGELIAEHFPRQQIQEMSGIALPTMAEKQQAAQQLQRMQAIAQQAQKTGQQAPPFDRYQIQELQEIASAPCTWEKVSAILRSDRRRCYLVEVETDQTAYRDEEADKSARIELLGVINQLMQQFGPMIAGNPANGEFFKQLIMFVVSAFKAGRAIEEGLEQSIDAAISQAAQQGQQQKPDPKQQTAEINLQIAQTRLQHEQVKMRNTQISAGADAQGKVQEQQFKVAEAQLKAQEAASKVGTQHMANEAKAAGHQIDLQAKAENLQFERATRATASEALLKGATRPPQDGVPPA